MDSTVITVEEVKAWVLIDDDADDAAIELLILAAQEQASATSYFLFCRHLANVSGAIWRKNALRCAFDSPRPLWLVIIFHETLLRNSEHVEKLSPKICRCSTA